MAIYAHRSAALALAILGVLKAGGVFVILDPAYRRRGWSTTWASHGRKAG